MKKILIKILATILYFYDSDKRKAFRVRHCDMTVFCRNLRQKGIIGSNTYIHHDCSIADKNSRIGKFCSIGQNVHIGTSVHPLHFLSTSPVSYQDISSLTDGIAFPKEKLIPFCKKTPVTIGNDVWIGLNVIIMDGVTIGDGAVIGSGAVVTHDVPPYAIAVGIPAKVLKYRFPEETIARLLKSKWWDRPDEEILSLPFNDIEAALQILEKNGADTTAG